MNFNKIKQIADIVRDIGLKTILCSIGAAQDKYDKNKWHTSKGAISVTGQKFMNWNQGIGGGGAIDLIIHLKNTDFKTAVFWLYDHYPAEIPVCISNSDSPSKIKTSLKSVFNLPERDNTKLPKVINYLINQRYIMPPLIKALIKFGRLYADKKGNAVFLLLGKEKRIVGAELRGTGSVSWKGMAPNSRKDLGYFFVWNYFTRKVILCESAIDAISCFCIHPDYISISTSGANPNPVWLKSFIQQNYDMYCGFDSDETGNKMAVKMIELYPTVKRLRPDEHDWNDLLIKKSKR